ncbi:MAG TPA: MgtC/SapB family protein [Opitutaceae bacterium]|nr:MgtC/SapB family protein [Opitutaceae bacterium]
MNEFSPTAEHWPFIPVLTRMGLAVALGIFIGLEREHSQKTGVRTFSLTGLSCCLGGLMGPMYAAFALAFVGIGIVGMNYREMAKTRKLALTTSCALGVVAFTGVLYGQGHMFTPTVAGILTAGLLAWKQPISRFADVVSERELRSAILLAILTFIVFPILPVHAVDPWGLVEPRSNWASVIIIAGIGFVNYILMRLLGARGLELTAFFGGLVNSRKVIVELGTRLKEVGPALLRPVERGIMLATGAMLIRNGLIVAVLATRAALRCVIPLLLMLLVSAVLWRRTGQSKEPAMDRESLHVESPFKLSAALKFGLVFLALNVAGALAQRHFGTASFYFVSVAGGLLSSASSIAAAASLMARNEITVEVGVNGIVLSTLTSVLANIPLIQSLMPEKALKRQLNVALVQIAAVGLVGVLVNNLVFHLRG